MLFPTSCPVCRTAGPSPCQRCRAALRPPPLLAMPAGLDALVVLASYEGVGRRLVASVKYGTGRSALPWLAAALAHRLGPLQVDLVAWVPTTGSRRRRRGFDQSRLLARRVARMLVVPCRPVLVRTGGAAQTGRSVQERRAGPALRTLGEIPARVLVVDDVVTTGSSLVAAASALRASGARYVVGAALAGTPLKVARVGADQ